MEEATFVLGPDVTRFEENFASYIGTRYCVGVESGTAALVLALQALDIGAGDEVIMPANTYIASALAVSGVGAKPVFVDVDDAYLVDAALLEAALTPRTKAIMPVHLYGQAVPMDRSWRLRGATDSRRRGCMSGARRALRRPPSRELRGRRDALASIQARISERMATVAPSLRTTPALDEKLRLLRDFGQRKKYEHLIKGWKLQARLDSGRGSRREASPSRRVERLPSAARERVRCEVAGDRDRSATSSARRRTRLSPVRDRGRESRSVAAALRERGIATGIHYPIPIHLQPAYRGFVTGSRRLSAHGA